MISKNAPLTQGDAVQPIDPPLPRLDIKWKVDNQFTILTPVEKDADSTSKINISAILSVDGTEVDIDRLEPVGLLDKYFKIHAPATSTATSSSTTPPSASTGAPGTPAGTGAAPSTSKEKSITLRCVFYLESENEFVSQRDKKRKEKIKIKIVPKHAAINKLALINGVDLIREFDVELTPCKLQILVPAPDCLGDPNNRYNEKTVIKSRVVRRKDKDKLDPSDPVGISGTDIDKDPGRNPSPRVWLEFVFKCPRKRLWLEKTMHKMAVFNQGKNRYEIKQWDGSHFDINAVKRTNGPYDSSDDWLANKNGLVWKHSINNPGTPTPPAPLRQKKKLENHIVSARGIDDKGFLKFSSDPHIHYGFEYNHIVKFGRRGGLRHEDEFVDLRNVNCVNYKTGSASPGTKGKSSNGSVEFILWYNKGSNLDDTNDWEKYGSRTVEILVPDINDNGDIPSGSKDWFLANSCYESLAIWFSKHFSSKEHEFNTGSSHFKRKRWGAHPNYFCHDFAWRMPGDRARVDLKGKEQEDWLAKIREKPEEFGFEQISVSMAEVNDIVIFKAAVQKSEWNKHSAIVMENPVIGRKTLLSKDALNGIFESTEASSDYFMKQYGLKGLTFFRRVKCYGCAGTLNGDEQWCQTCGPAIPGKTGYVDWRRPKPRLKDL